MWNKRTFVAVLSVLVLFIYSYDYAYALSTFQTIQGGTGTSSPSGILYGDNGATSHVNTVTVGSGLTFSGGTLSASASGAAYPFPKAGNSTTTLTNFLGGIGASTVNATSTASSTILNLNTVYYVPTDFATNGCAGKPGDTDFGACVNDLVALGHTQGYNAVEVHVPDIKVPAANWSTPINPAITNFIWSLDCVRGATLIYGGTGTSTLFDMANPIGHTVSDDYGCIYQGSSSFIAAGQTNTNTTTGVGFGGGTAGQSGHGAVGVNFHDNTINGFGRDVETAANAYMLSFHNNAISGGNGGNILGNLFYEDTSANSGERLVVDGNAFTDPGNSVATSSVYLLSGGQASAFFTNNSFDDVGVYCGASNGQCDFTGNHWENSDSSQYNGYYPLENPSSDKSTSITFNNNEIANDASGANSFQGIVDHGGQLTAIGNHIDNYAGGTVSWFARHANDNGVSSELICQTQVQGGSLTNLVQGNGNVAYSLATGSTCITDNGNSYPIGLVANSNNLNDIISGTTNVATFDHSGNWTFPLGTFQLTPLATAAGALLAVDGSGNVITTTTPSSGGSSFAYPFTPSTDNGIKTSATSTPIEGTNPGLGLDVANTSWYGLGGLLLAYSSTTNQDTIFGFAAGGQNATTSATAGKLTAIGLGALQDNTTGTQNTAVGEAALLANLTAGDSTAVGYAALNNTTGAQNTAVGSLTLVGNNAGADNTALGYKAGNAGTGAFQRSTFIGDSTNLNSNTIILDTTELGYKAGFNNTGWDSSFLGEQSGQNVTSGNNNVLIGFNALAQSATASNQLNIGNFIFGTSLTATSSSATVIPISGGYLGISTTSPAWALQVATSSTGSLFNHAQFAITDTQAGLNLKHWLFSNENGNLFISSSSDLYASSSIAALTINTNGYLGIGTTSPGSLLSIGGVANFTVGTSTFYGTGGVNLSAGCYAVNGTCLSQSISNATAYKQAVTYATTAALPANTYLSGVLTEVGTGTLSVDGASPTVGQRILVKNEGTQTNNGIYTVTATGSGIAAYVLTRATDYNTSADIYPGVASYVLLGTANGDTTWALTTPAVVVLDTSNLTYAESANGNISLPISVANGGTGASTLGATQFLYGNGTSAVLSTSNFIYNPQGLAGMIGIGSSTPFAELSISTTTTQSVGTSPLFDIASSTNATLFEVFGNGNVSIGTTSPPVAGLTVATGTIFNPELTLATTTTMFIGIASSTQQLVRYGTAAMTLNISAFQLIPGEKTTIVTCNPQAVGGAITFTNLHYSGGLQPGNTTAANQCDEWFISVTSGSTSPEAVLTGMTPGVQ